MLLPALVVLFVSCSQPHRATAFRCPRAAEPQVLNRVARRKAASGDQRRKYPVAHHSACDTVQLARL
jgi:hypothetical protein